MIFHMQISGKGERKTYIFGPGHMTKTSAISLYGRSLKTIFFFRITWPVALKLSSMQHFGLQYYQNYINDDSSLTLTYFTPWLNAVP